MPYKDPDARRANAREASRRWHAANREKNNARTRAYYAANREKTLARQRAYARTEEGKAAIAAKARAWRAKNPERTRQISNDWKKRNGYSSWQVYQRRMETIAGGKRPDTCEACGRGGKIVFDHCHSADSHPRDRTTRALSHFRGWLCERCNIAVGMVDNSPEILRQLAEYLLRPRS